MSTVKTIEKIDAREIRRKLGMNQQQFWSTLGVTQSGGSRYESGRNMPKPVRELLRLVHVEQIDIKSIKREDWDVVEYLKTHAGWHAKSDILAATRITDGQWNAATADLISGGKVERQGERRGDESLAGVLGQQYASADALSFTAGQ